VSDQRSPAPLFSLNKWHFDRNTARVAGSHRGALWMVGEPLPFCVTLTLPQGGRTTMSPGLTAPWRALARTRSVVPPSKASVPSSARGTRGSPRIGGGLRSAPQTSPSADDAIGRRGSRGAPRDEVLRGRVVPLTSPHDLDSGVRGAWVELGPPRRVVPCAGWLRSSPVRLVNTGARVSTRFSAAPKSRRSLLAPLMWGVQARPCTIGPERTKRADALRPGRSTAPNC
jgi:hypothetical protein